MTNPECLPNTFALVWETHHSLASTDHSHLRSRKPTPSLPLSHGLSLPQTQCPFLSSRSASVTAFPSARDASPSTFLLDEFIFQGPVQIPGTL